MNDRNLASKDDLTPRTAVAATDGWSGDAIAVPVEFAQRLERAAIRLHALLCRTLDDYRGSLPDPERVEVSSDTRHRLMHIKDRMREADALLDGRLTAGETSVPLDRVLSCLENRAGEDYRVQVREGHGERFWTELADAFVERRTERCHSGLGYQGEFLTETQCTLCEGHPGPHQYASDPRHPKTSGGTGNG